MSRNKINECTVFFRRYYDGTEAKIKLPHSDSAIPEMVDSFLDFLRACGYIDPEEAVLEKMMEYADNMSYTIPSKIPEEVPRGIKKSFSKR